MANNLSNKDKARIDLNGHLDQAILVEKFALYVKDVVPTHKTITVKIEKALNAKLAEIVKFTESYNWEGKPNGQAYSKAYFRIVKGYSSGYELQLFVQRTRADRYSDRADTRSEATTITGLETPADVTEALFKLVKRAEGTISDMLEQLSCLDQVEADYKALEQARESYRGKYSYIVREYFPIK